MEFSYIKPKIHGQSVHYNQEIIIFCSINLSAFSFGAYRNALKSRKVYQTKDELNTAKILIVLGIVTREQFLYYTITYTKLTCVL